MLPLLRDQWRIALCPDKVILVCLGKGLRREVKFKVILTFTPLPDAPAWQAPVSVLGQWLEMNHPGRADATVTLSNHFVRYALMPFSVEAGAPAEEQALAQAILEETYGDAARQWQVRISDGAYNEPRLVAALDSEFLAAIVKAAAPVSLRLVSVKPYLMAAFNGLHKQIRESEGLFAVAEQGQMTAVAFRKGKLVGVRRYQLNSAPEEQLPGLLQREALLCGLDAGTAPVYLHVAGKPDFKLPPGSGTQVRPVRLADNGAHVSLDDPDFDMACWN